MIPRDILRKTADLIEERGHAQGRFVDDHGRFCIRGAALRVTSIGKYVNARRSAYRMLVEYLGISADSATDAVTEWNDAPGRTAAEVVAALRGAAGGEP